MKSVSDLMPVGFPEVDFSPYENRASPEVRGKQFHRDLEMVLFVQRTHSAKAVEFAPKWSPDSYLARLCEIEDCRVINGALQSFLRAKLPFDAYLWAVMPWAPVPKTQGYFAMLWYRGLPDARKDQLIGKLARAAFHHGPKVQLAEEGFIFQQFQAQVELDLEEHTTDNDLINMYLHGLTKTAQGNENDNEFRHKLLRKIQALSLERVQAALEVVLLATAYSNKFLCPVLIKVFFRLTRLRGWPSPDPAEMYVCMQRLRQNDRRSILKTIPLILSVCLQMTSLDNDSVLDFDSVFPIMTPVADKQNFLKIY